MPLRYRHDYAADLHRGLPAGDLKPAQEFPARHKRGGCAPRSSPYPPDLSWRET